MPLIKNSPLKVGKLMVCAVYELELISEMASPADTIRSFWENPEVTVGPYPPPDGRKVLSRKPFILFSATTRPLTRHLHIYKAAHENPSYGKDLKKYIEDNNLGLVTESEERQNGTGNWLKIYLWHVEWDQLANFMKPQDAEEYKQIQAENVAKAKPNTPPTPSTSPSGLVDAVRRIRSMTEGYGISTSTSHTGSGR